MARINIEDSLWSDPRFMRLCIALSDEMRAVGAVVLAWRTAQKFWCPDRQPIPTQDFEAAGLPFALIECGLAEEIDDGIRMKGSDEHFAWWFQRQAAGRAGGLASGTKRSLSGRQRSSSGTKQNEPSSSSSSSEETTNTLPIGMGPSAPIPKKFKYSESTRLKMKAFIAAYADGYREKYGASPEGVRDKGVIGKLGHWIEMVSEEHALRLVGAYLKIDHRRITESQHDLWQFFYHLNRIGNALANHGANPDGIDWSKVFGGENVSRSA